MFLAGSMSCQRWAMSLARCSGHWLDIVFCRGRRDVILKIRSLLAFLALCVFTTYSFGLEPVRLQLKWKHQFQFAGYYAALEKGYYREAGLDVEIIEASPEHDPVDSVLEGGAEYGVGTSELLLLHQYGKPVVVLGVIFQHSPLALLVPKNASEEKTWYTNISTIQDVKFKPLMIEDSSAELFAYMALEGLSRQDLNIVQHSFDIKDVLKGRVAGMSVYVTDEPYEFEKLNIAYNLFKPSAGGIDFYGDNLFTTETEVQKHPQRVKAFKEASMRGWRYAMRHPDEIIDLIYDKHSQRHSKAHLKFEYEQMKPLLQAELIEPGYMHAGRWQHIASTYADQGMLPEDYDMSGFLYHDEPVVSASTIKNWVMVVSAVLIMAFIISAYVWRLNARLRKRGKWLNTVVDNAPSALMIVDKSSSVIEWNHSAEALFGWKSAEVISKSVYDFIVPLADQTQLCDDLNQVFATGKPLVQERWSRTKDGAMVLCEWHYARLQNDRVLAMGSDITERKALENKLSEMAHSDALTGVANRTLFFQKLEEAIALAKRRHEKVAVLFIDLDDFKIVNDQYGHEVGDVVLCEVVQRIKMAVREADVLARIGGDEFVLILHDCESTQHAMNVGEKVLFHLERPIQVSGLTVTIGGSIGISMYPENGDRTTDILKSADRAMYEVKQREKNGVGIAPPKPNREGSVTHKKLH